MKSRKSVINCMCWHSITWCALTDGIIRNIIYYLILYNIWFYIIYLMNVFVVIRSYTARTALIYGVIGRASYLISWRSGKQWKCILLYMWDIMAVSRLITLAEMKALAWFHGYGPTPVAESSRKCGTSTERKRKKSRNEWNCSKHGSFHYNLWLLYINSKSMNTMWTKHNFSCWEWKLCLHSISLFKRTLVSSRWEITS